MKSRLALQRLVWTTRRRWLWLPLVAIAAGAHAADPADGPHSPLPPDLERAALRLADPALSIELVAAEPDVVSPVAIGWDADGALYVAEMIGYPDTPGLGRIKRLTPRAGGGYERASVFADKLNFPASVMAYGGGVLVADAPDILFFKDNRAAGQADERHVVWTGFGEGNQQLRVNALHWGLDNWIYGANGRSDGAIRRPDAPRASAVSIGRRDFRFRPPNGQFEAISGQSQFGMTHDDWGNRFLSWNTVPIRHALLNERYLARNPHLASRAVIDIAEPGDTGQVFPISPRPRQFNGERADYYNAMCGLTIYRGDLLGREYGGNAFICESLTNLVTRRRLSPDGPTFVSERVDKNREFLASIDSWFHPVFLTTGPDGALYVVDFYRELVEHPEWVTPALRAGVDWRNGDQHGRIWRIARREPVPKSAPTELRLSHATAAQLVEQLSHPVGWWRDTAQRLLVERHEVAAAAALRRVLRESTTPVARLHALWTLEGLAALDDDTLASVLRQADPRLRRQALVIAEGGLPGSTTLRSAVATMTAESDSAVAFQLALTLATLDGAAATEQLTQIARTSRGDRWLLLAIATTGRGSGWPMLRGVVGQTGTWLQAPSDHQAKLLRQLAALVGENRDQGQLADCLTWITSNGREAQAGSLAIVAGLAEGLERSGASLRQLAADRPQPLREPLAHLQSLAAAAEKLATDEKRPPSERAAAIDVLGQTGAIEIGQTLLALLRSGPTQEVRSAAARALAKLDDAEPAAAIFGQWSEIGPATRREILASALQSPAATAALISALERSQVLPVEVTPQLREDLLHLPNAELKARAAKLLSATVAADRKKVLADYQIALTAVGDRRRGAALFRDNCLTCHVLQGHGHQVGPDLSGVAARARDALLSDVLDPSQQVAPNYVAYTVTTRRGKLVTGLIAAETETGVTLRRGEGVEETVLRSEIEELRASGKSLMPDGMEQKLNPQAMADLLAFLAQPDASLLADRP